jgi:hypothetical protein
VLLRGVHGEEGGMKDGGVLSIQIRAGCVWCERDLTAADITAPSVDLCILHAVALARAFEQVLPELTITLSGPEFDDPERHRGAARRAG